MLIVGVDGAIGGALWRAKVRRRGRVCWRSGLAYCPWVGRPSIPLAPPDWLIATIISVVESGENELFWITGADDCNYANAARRLAALPDGAVSRPCLRRRPKSRRSKPRHTPIDTDRITAMTRFRPPRALDPFDAVYGPVLARARTTAMAHG
jgi:hypothetical protein